MGANYTFLVSTLLQFTLFQLLLTPFPLHWDIPGCVYLDVSLNGEQVYVTCGLQGISIINTATNQVALNAIPTPAGSQQIALTPNGQTAYVSTFNDSVQAIDLAKGKVKATIRLPDTSIGGPARYLTVSPNGKRLFIYYQTGKNPNQPPKQNVILVTDTTTNKVIKKIPSGELGQAGQTGLTPDGKFLYAPIGFLSTPGSAVLMLDTATNKIADSIGLAGYLQALAVAPTAPFACAIGIYGNNDEGEAYVIDISPE